MNVRLAVLIAVCLFAVCLLLERFAFAEDWPRELELIECEAE